MGDRVRQKVSPVLVVLASEEGGRGSLVAMADREAVELGVNCGLLVRRIASGAGRRRRRKTRYGPGRFQRCGRDPVSLKNVRRIVLEMTGKKA